MSNRAERDSAPPHTIHRLARPVFLATGAALLLGWWLVSGGPGGIHATSQRRTPPDLALKWLDGRRETTSGTPVRGIAGQTVEVEYRVRNLGGTDAYSVVVSGHTALGRCGQPQRLQPGPQAGGARDGHLPLTLARGMRELCLEARLQTLAADEPKDRQTQNNRLCRTVEARERPDVTGVGLPPDFVRPNQLKQKER